MPIDPLTATAIAATGKWMWDSYGKQLVDELAKELANRREARDLRQQWQQATADYLEKLQDQIKFVGILGKTGGRKALDQIYTDVHLLDELSANRRYGLAGLEAEFVSRQPRRREDSKRLKGEAVVAREQRLFILGKPGAGKTTFLKQVAWRTIIRNRQDDQVKKLPIFVTLKELSDSGLALVPFIEAQFERAGFPNAAAFVKQFLKAGDAIVLLDGLDEVSQEEKQADLIKAINQFIFAFHRCQLLLTCRLAANSYDFKGFSYVEMADFSPEQQKTFIYRWFDKRQDKEACWQALQDSQNKTLQELARIPLLLSLLCVLFEARPDKDFPKERHQIYREATQALLGRWDEQDKLILQRDPIYDALSPEHKEALLADIAAQTFEKEEYFIPQQRLANLIEAYLRREQISQQPDGVFVLRAMEAQHGLLVERARNIHSFSHLTLQEYLTAHYIVANEARGSLLRLMTYVGDDRWREVFLLTAAMLNDASQFARLYLQALTDLVAADQTLTAMLEWGAAKSVNLPSRIRPPAARAFRLFLARSLARFHANNRNNALEFGHAFALILTLLLDQDFALTYSSIFARVFAIDSELTQPFDLSDNLDSSYLFEHAHSFLHAFDLDFPRALTLDVIITWGPVWGTEIPQTASGIIAQLRKLKQDVQRPLLNELTMLQVPRDDVPIGQLQAFNRSFEEIVKRHWELEQLWELSSTQTKLLTQYLQANWLLLDCLELAYVPERQAIVDQLLLPPG